MNEGRDYEEKTDEIRAFYSCETRVLSEWTVYNLMRCWQKILSRVVVTFYLDETIFTWITLLKTLKIPDFLEFDLFLFWFLECVTKKSVKRMCQNILARKFKDDDNYRRRVTFHTFSRKKSLVLKRERMMFICIEREYMTMYSQLWLSWAFYK